MIMTLRTMDYQGLLSLLPEDAKVLIWGCNTCARMCGGLGGKDAARKLADLLQEDGRTVILADALTATCLVSAVRKRMQRPDFEAVLKEATHVIPLTCHTGLDVLLREMPHLKVIDVGRTVGLGYLSESRGAVLTQSIVKGFEVPPEGVPLSVVADELGLYMGPFERFEGLKDRST